MELSASLTLQMVVLKRKSSAKTKHIVKKFLTLRPHFSVGHVIVGNSITLSANREDESFGYNHVCLTDFFTLAFRML